MREGIVVEVSAADRVRLEAVVADRNRPQKHVWRARIVLLTAAGLGTNAVMRETGKSKTWEAKARKSLPARRTRAKNAPLTAPADPTGWASGQCS
jgi:hypothetical protein